MTTTISDDESIEDLLAALETERDRLATQLTTTADAAELWMLAQELEDVEDAIATCKEEIRSQDERGPEAHLGYATHSAHVRDGEEYAPPPAALPRRIQPEVLEFPEVTLDGYTATLRTRAELLSETGSELGSTGGGDGETGEDSTSAPTLVNVQANNASSRSSANASSWSSALEALTGGEMTTVVLTLSAVHGIVLAYRGAEAFADGWWRTAVILILFVALRSYARVGHVARPTGTGPGRPSWTKITALLGATATAIAAVIQAGNVVLQHSLAVQSQEERHALEKEQAMKAYEQELVARAQSYLQMVLTNDSYEKRQTLLGYFTYVRTTETGSVFEQQLREWSVREQERLDANKQELLAILQTLVDECKKDEERCKEGRAHRNSIIAIVQQVGPGSLGRERGAEIARLGIPIALISKHDLDLIGLGVLAGNGSVELGEPTVTGQAKPAAKRAEEPRRGGSSARDAGRARGAL